MSKVVWHTLRLFEGDLSRLTPYPVFILLICGRRLLIFKKK